MPKRTSKASSHFDALFGARQGEQLTSGLKLIPRDKIERGEQPRQTFPAQEISELAMSLAELRQRGEGIEGTGFLQPILVTEQADGYRLIAGERRYRASGEAGIELLPAVVVTMSRSNLLLAQLVENLQRRDLPPLEEARGMSSLMKEQKLSLRETARVLGKGKGYVENRLNLLKMGADIQEMVSVQTDTLLHARDIDSVLDPQLRQELIRAVLQDGLSRAELRRRIAPSPEHISQVLVDEPQASQKAISQAENKPSNAFEQASETSEMPPGQQEKDLLLQLDSAVALLKAVNSGLQSQPVSHQSDESFLSERVSLIETQIWQMKEHLKRAF